MNETEIQYRLYEWLRWRKKHERITPNSNVYGWEADMISVTRAGYVHEWEIKRTLADFKHDQAKRWKHRRLSGLETPWYADYKSGPTYFWYLCWSFEPPMNLVPEYAGLALMRDGEHVYWHNRVKVLKEAPRRRKGKASNSLRERLDTEMYLRYWTQQIRRFRAAGNDGKGVK